MELNGENGKDGNKRGGGQRDHETNGGNRQSKHQMEGTDKTKNIRREQTELKANGGNMQIREKLGADRAGNKMKKSG